MINRSIAHAAGVTISSALSPHEPYTSCTDCVRYNQMPQQIRPTTEPVSSTSTSSPDIVSPHLFSVGPTLGSPTHRCNRPWAGHYIRRFVMKNHHGWSILSGFSEERWFIVHETHG